MPIASTSLLAIPSCPCPVHPHLPKSVLHPLPNSQHAASRCVSSIVFVANLGSMCIMRALITSCRMVHIKQITFQQGGCVRQAKGAAKVRVSGTEQPFVHGLVCEYAVLGLRSRAFKVCVCLGMAVVCMAGGTLWHRVGVGGASICESRSQPWITARCNPCACQAPCLPENG